MGWLGAPEIILLLVVALLLFGAKRLPEIGRSLGSGMREFKDSVTGNSKDDDTPTPELTATTVPPPAEPVAGQELPAKRDTV